MDIRKIGFALIISISFINAIGQNSTSNKSTNGGEKLRWVLSYNVTSLWTDVGEANIEVKEIDISGKPVLHISGAASSYPSYDVFFRVRDSYQSWVDPVSLKPMVFLRDVNEGGYTKKEKYVFHRNDQFAQVTFQKNQNPAENLKIPITDGIYDAVSILYIARNLNYKMYPPHTKFQQNILIDKSNIKISIEYLGKEKLNTIALGSYNCIKIRVYMIKEKQEKQAAYSDLWLSDDENRIPLYMHTPLKIGSIQAKILEMSGLKNTVSSKI